MPENEDLSDIVKRMKEGNDDALKIVYDSYYSNIWFICSKICDSKEDVEEVIQDTFFRAFKYIKKLNEPSALNAWIRKIAIMECYRKNKKRPVDYIYTDDTEVEDIQESDTSFLPEEYVQKMELRADIIKIIDNLPRKQRDAIYLYYYAGMTTSEIAKLNKCSAGSVRMSLHHARNTIKQKIEEKKKSTNFYSFSPMPLALLLHTEEKSAAASLGLGTEQGFKTVVRHLRFSKLMMNTAAGVVTAVVIGGAALVFPKAAVVPPIQPILQQELTPSPTPTASVTTSSPTEEPSVVESTEQNEALPETPEPVIEEVVEDEAVTEIIPQVVPDIQETEAVTEIPQPTEPPEIISTPSPEPAAVTQEEPEPEPEPPEITDIQDILSDADTLTLQNSGTPEQINDIISRYGFNLHLQGRNSMEEEYKLYELQKNNKRILIGIYSNPPENQWHIKYSFVDADAPLMGMDGLRNWLNNN